MTGCVESILSIGTNRGDRIQNLNSGLQELKQIGYSIDRISPVVETPADLPPNSPAEWNCPFLNLVVKGSFPQDSESFYVATKKIQSRYERRSHNKWAPRSLDIDIVSWGNHPVLVNGKTVPDTNMILRPYVLSPLVHMAPDTVLPGYGDTTVFDLSCDHQDVSHIPMWMGIVNITPDSFSDGGALQTLDEVEESVRSMIWQGANIIDIGAESTRPNAEALSSDEEWIRLKPAIQLVQAIVREFELSPLISIDTYHSETAQKCLEYGVDIINDVCGLSDPKMMEIAKESDKTFIAMHSITVPVRPDAKLDPRENACEAFSSWVRGKQNQWAEQGLNPDRVIIDPGVGFGKNSLQNLDLMESIREFRQLGHRVMVGHSRKRFSKSFSEQQSKDLDAETLGASLQMCAQSVDILRVHNVEVHTRAYLSWLHLKRKQNRTIS